MLRVEKSDVILNWLKPLRDMQAGALIQVRIDRLALRFAGDGKPVGAGVKT
jgi:putative component of toxin-antitoxin plasmid stabilization module